MSRKSISSNQLSILVYSALLLQVAGRVENLLHNWSALGDSAIALVATSLNPLGINPRSSCCCKSSLADLLFALVIDVFEVESVNVSWDYAKECEEDVDQKISSASCDSVDTGGWENKSDDDQENS